MCAVVQLAHFDGVFAISRPISGVTFGKPCGRHDIDHLLAEQREYLLMRALLHFDRVTRRTNTSCTTAPVTA